MTQRDRQVLVYILAGLGAMFAVGFLGFQLFWKPYQENKRTIVRLEKESEEKRDQILAVNKGKKLLEKARMQSLPSNLSTARTEYREFIEKELGACNLPPDEIRELAESRPVATVAGKKEAPAHTVLAFQVGTQGTLANFVAFLERMKSTPLMHRIKSFTVERPEQVAGQKGPSSKLKVGMVIEALVVNRSDNHTEDLLGPEYRLAVLDSMLALRQAPLGIGMIAWAMGPTGPKARHQLKNELKDRTYADLTHRNIFLGDVPKAAPKDIIAAEEDDDIDVRSWVKLSSITHREMENGKVKYYAELRNYFGDVNNQLSYTKLSLDLGYRIFTIKNESLSKTILRGHVLRIDQHNVYFQVSESVYRMEMGQTMTEAMRRPLRDADLEELTLVRLEADPDDVAFPEAGTKKGAKKQKR